MNKKIKNKTFRVFLCKSGYKIFYLKYILFNVINKKNFYMYLKFKLDKSFVKFNVSKLNYSCVISFRNFANFNYFKLSRLKVKNLASFGVITGLKKASW